MSTKDTIRREGRQTLRLRDCLDRLRLACGAGREQRAGICRQFARGEEGQTIVEMALASAVALAFLFGIIQFSLALYTYNFIDEAAREATRYAVVRGVNSCTISPNFPDCNLDPNSAGNPLQAYVQSLGYPGLNAANLTVTTTWFTAAGTQPETWTTPCVAPTTGCNTPGNAVKVQVQYAFPLALPFVRVSTLNLSSQSEMVISE